MENQEKNALDRMLESKHFEDAMKAIEDGKKSGSLVNAELIEDLVEKYKGKTIQAPLEVIITSAVFFNAREIMGVIEALKHTLHMKIVEELKDKADKGEATAEDAMAALMLAAIMGKENTKQKDE